MATKKSWKQLVKQADADQNKRVDVYVFSNGRKFKEKRNPYGN